MQSTCILYLIQPSLVTLHENNVFPSFMKSVDPPGLEPYEDLVTYACDANADKMMLSYYVTTDVLVKQG